MSQARPGRCGPFHMIQSASVQVKPSLGIWKCDQLLRFPTISKISRMENVPVCKSISLMTPCPCSNKRRCIDGERSLLTTVFGCGKDGSSLSGFSCVNLLAAALLHCCSKEGEEDCDDELLDRELHARFMVHCPMKP